MARSNKFVNPGKSTLFTVLSLMLIIGIPGLVAYADGSDVTYNSLTSDSLEVNQVFIYDSTLAARYDFGVTTSLADDEYTAVIDSTATDETTQLSSLTAMTNFAITFVNLTDCDNLALFEFTTDLSPSSVMFKFLSNGTDLLDVTSTYDADTGVYSHEFSSVEKVQLVDIDAIIVELFFTASAAPDDFTYTCSAYSAETVFTDDVVEMIVLVGGICLLVCGTFSLSFIDLDTPGKAFRAAGRGIKNASRRH